MGLLSTIGAASGRAFGLTRVGAAIRDAYFNLTTLLLPGNGTNGAQNNTFLDSSTNNFTITRNGNTTQGTFSPFSQTGWSNFFDGTDDYIAVADNAVLRPGASNFTLEAWVWRNASGAAHTIYAKGGASTGIVFQVTSTNVLRFTHTTTNIDSTGTIAANAWTHVAVVREGTGTNQTKLYINGTQDGQGTVSTDFTQTEEVRIGTDRSAAADFNGYISNLRFVKGTALYTGAFTPSTSPLTTTSQGATATEVELLTCQSNRFVDNSSNGFTLTITGTPSVQAFSPFAPTAEYSAATVGGSGYLDGTGDYLSVASNAAFQFGTGDFTVEAWWYPTTISSTYQTIACVWVTGNLGWILQARSTDVLISIGSGFFTVTGSATIVANQWYHVAASRNGTTVRVFLNGTQLNTGTSSASGTASTALQIGRNEDGNQQYVNGYLSSLRIVKGQGLATGSFTPPTDPVTTTAVGWTGANAASSITGTVSLLTNFTNAGITDATAKNDLETIGNAQISTTQSKFGGSSIFFNGSVTALTTPALTPAYLFQNNSDWTIEFWFYTGTSTGTMGIFDTYFTNASPYSGMLIQMINGTISVYDGASNRATTTTYANSTWHHFAWVNSAGTSRIYINGSNVTIGGVTSWTTPSNIFRANAPIQIGRDYAPNYFTGYIDDLRVTKYARYTANFTAPTSSFALQ